MDAGLHSLKTVREHASGLRDEAQRALQQAERQLAQASAQADTLRSYRHETAKRWGTPLNRPISVAQLQSAHHFLARLDNAFDQQTLALQHAQTLAQRRRSELQAAETHLAALDKLIQRREQAAMAQQQRREQRANDEYAQRITAAHAAMRDDTAEAEPELPRPTQAPHRTSPQFTANAAPATEPAPCPQ